MGQGQAEVAMQLLHECCTSGDWLCLKNLHLVTAWLPTLEKVQPGPCCCETHMIVPPKVFFPSVLLSSFLFCGAILVQFPCQLCISAPLLCFLRISPKEIKSSFCAFVDSCFVLQLWFAKPLYAPGTVLKFCV